MENKLQVVLVIVFVCAIWPGHQTTATTGSTSDDRTLEKTSIPSTSKATICMIEHWNISNADHAADITNKTDFAVDETLPYTCKERFGIILNNSGNFIRNGTATCMSSSIFQGSPCELIECQVTMLNNSLHNIITNQNDPNMTKYTLDDKLPFNCTDGYGFNETNDGDIQTEGNVTCLQSGFFEVKSCNVSICMIKHWNDSNANITGFGNKDFLKVNKTVPYTCKTGFGIRQDNGSFVSCGTATCNSTNSLNFKPCETIKCQVTMLNNSLHSNITNQNDSNMTEYTLGDKLLFNCTDGYGFNETNDGDIQTEGNVTCLQSGFFEVKSCNVSICMIKHWNDSNANITGFGNKDFLKVNKTVPYTCKTGFGIRQDNGSFVSCGTATCNSTNSLNFKPCETIICPNPNTTNNGTFTPKQSYLYNETVKYQCDHGYEIARGSTSVLRCTENATWSHHTPLCVDIDECNRNGYRRCDVWASCTNSPGSYKCTCNSGFIDRDHGFNCEDINECHDKTDNCSRNESQTFACFNTYGGYICVCHDGWTGTYCENDIDECAWNNTCGENAFCTNFQGGYNCTYNCKESFPSGDPKYHCFENIIISLETKGRFHQGNNEIIDAVPIKYRFPYFGVEYKFFRPAMNGFLSLGFQKLYDRNGPQTPGAWKTRTFGMSVVAPLWGNLNSENISGGLSVNYFEEYIHYGKNDSEHRDLEKLGEVMTTCYNLTHFDPRVAIVVTWKNVTRWDTLPASVMVFRENATMQAILISDGVYSYIIFNYDRAHWSLQQRNFVNFTAGYSLEDKTGHILADNSNYTTLGINSNCDLNGRWAFNVTKSDTGSNHLVDEATCLQFHENQTIRDWYKEQMKRSYPCPCDEVIMQFDYTYQKLPVESDGKTICYQSWFFMEGIKQECCYRYGAIVKMGTDGAGQAAFEDDPYNITIYHDACCSGDKHLCRLYYDVIPPDSCSRWKPDDEGSIQRIKRSVLSYMPFGGNTAQSAYRSTSNILLNVLFVMIAVVPVYVCF